MKVAYERSVIRASLLEIPSSVQVPRYIHAGPISSLIIVLLRIVFDTISAIGEKGMKETAKEKARDIARGRSKFATKAPPQLTVVRNE